MVVKKLKNRANVISERPLDITRLRLNLRPRLDILKIKFRPCQDHVFQVHVCHVHVCLDHVCQDHVCQEHVCQDLLSIFIHFFQHVLSTSYDSF